MPNVSPAVHHRRSPGAPWSRATPGGARRRGTRPPSAGLPATTLDRPAPPDGPDAQEYERATLLLDEARDALRGGQPARATATLVRAQALLAEVARAAASAAGTPDELDALDGSAPTDAERRVLVLLATDLTLSEIGGELFLSRNTVKTHVWRLYRRLGVRTRAEAVEVARAAGHLLPADPSPPHR